MQQLVADDGKSACHALTEVGRPGGYAETPVCGTLLRGAGARISPARNGGGGLCPTVSSVA